MEKSFLNILNKFDDAICFINSDRIIIYANPVYCKLYEKSPEEILGKTYHSLIPPEQQEVVDKRFYQVLQSDVPQKFNWYLIKDDGGVLSLSSFNFKINIDGFDVVVSKLHEVSSEKKNEKILVESEKLAQIGGWELEVNSGTVRWSEEIFRIYELDTDSAPGLDTCISYFEKDARDSLRGFLNDAVENFTSFDKCFKLITAKGNTKWVRISCKPETILGNIFRLFGTIQDVTLMKMNEDELRKLSLVASNTTNGVIITNDKDEIEWINAGFTKMYGYELDELKFKKPGQFLRSSKSDPVTGNKIDSQSLARIPFASEIINEKKDGSEFWVHIVATPIYDESNNYIGYVTITTDINELKKSEEQLKQKNEELLKTNSELDNFVYSVSHDIRAPVASILGLISIAKSEQNDITQLDYLNIIEDNVNRLDSFVRDIVDYSQNSRLEIQHEEINFNEIIEGIISQFDLHTNFKSINFNLNYDIQFPFYTDSHRVKIILKNLISNSINFHDGSKSSPFIRLTVSCNSKKAEITIEDNGQGIKEEIVPKIFDMFFSSDYATTGSGLGLYIVKESLKKIDGEILVNSSFGFGTTFKIFIPNLNPPKDN